MARQVLIIEDDHNIADLLRLYLEKDGYEVTIAPDGIKGVERFREIHPDLVLLDVMFAVLFGGRQRPPLLCSLPRAKQKTRSSA